MPSENTKRIAKNTAFLYMRMLLLMGVAFYTSRVVLNALGVEDYGIYNVVGGVVAMFSFLTGTFTSATQRFLNYEMGLGNQQRLHEIFSMSITLNVIIAVLIIGVSEIVGIWFINHKLVIPPDRLVAAHWVFQFSLLAMAVTIVSTPYNALIIAHERMDIFAYISIVEALLKLGIAVVIFFCGGDKLIVYAFLILLVALIVRLIYSFYCKRKFPECRYKFYWDRKLFCEMGSFAGWNMYGNFAFVVVTQGLNMLLNMFFGPAVNASRAIAVQVQTAIQGFATNFTMAVNPQITQYYAQRKMNEMFNLVCFSSKCAFFLLLILIVPVLLETEMLLKLWLKQVPAYSVIFVRLILIRLLLTIIVNPLHTSIHATGKMKFYQLLTGSLTLLNIPVSYLLLCLGMEPTTVFLVDIVICFLMLFALLYVLHREMKFPFLLFMRKVWFVILKVSVVIGLCAFLVGMVHWSYSYVEAFVKMFLMVCVAFVAVWFLGMTCYERLVIKKYIVAFVSKFKTVRHL